MTMVRKELANALKENTSLDILGLGRNNIKDDGAIHCEATIEKENTSLITLNLSSNQISDDSFSVFADAFKVNTTLIKFSMNVDRDKEKSGKGIQKLG